MINEGILKPVNSMTISKILDAEARSIAKKARARKADANAE
jgi:hypothetical protein